MTEVQMRSFLEGHFYASKKIKALEEERRQLRITAQGGAVNYEGNYTTTKSNPLNAIWCALPMRKKESMRR